MTNLVAVRRACRENRRGSETDRQRATAAFIVDGKAFDIVNNQKMFECMEKLDINGKDISLFRNLYWKNKKHTREQKIGCHRKFTSKNEYDRAVCYHIVCLICTQNDYLGGLIRAKA